MALETALEAITAGDWQKVAGPLVQPILAKASADPEALLADMASLYPDMDDAALNSQLARCIFVADVWGRLDDA